MINYFGNLTINKEKLTENDTIFRFLLLFLYKLFVNYGMDILKRLV